MAVKAINTDDYEYMHQNIRLNIIDILSNVKIWVGSFLSQFLTFDKILKYKFLKISKMP